MTVTFDKNVYEFVVDPDKPAPVSTDDRNIYLALHHLIADGKIQPFLSESILTYEVVAKAERKKVLSSGHPLLVEHSMNGISIYSNPAIHPGNHNKDTYFLTKAIQMGFKILPGKRFGKLVNPDVKSEWYHSTNEDYLATSGRFAEIVKVIQDMGAGYAQYQALTSPPEIQHLPVFERLKLYKGSERRLSAAISEWSDGDAVALHLTYGLDYFCTHDEAKAAGKNSVFSDVVCQQLEQKFNFNKVTAQQLLVIAQQESH